MKSRMEKYYKDENVLQRTAKNDSLYEELYREKKEPTSNVTVLDNVNEIDITKIKQMVDSREQHRKVRNYENLMSMNDLKEDATKEYRFDEIDDSSYDINQILERKREDRFPIDDSRLRKINNIELKEIDRKSDDNLDFTMHDEKIKTLINTIIGNEETDDLFANLRETDDEKKEEQTFYTNTDTFDNKDFDIEEDKPLKDAKGSKSLVVISIIALLIAIGVFVWYKFFT